MATESTAPAHPSTSRESPPRLGGAVSNEESESGPPDWLLVTDVDDTLLGDSAAFAEFVAAVAPAAHLTVVLNSSRPIHSLHGTIAELPTTWRPYGMIGALGTEIEIDGRTIESWGRRFGSFVRGPIDVVMSRLGCAPHDDEYQTPLKASFSVPSRMQTRAVRTIRRTGVAARVIRSGDSAFDVIPALAGKGAALREARALLGVPRRRTVAAGDSYNDLDMLEDVAAIVVGNAVPGLRFALRRRGRRVHFAARTHAAGVLEGLRSLGVPLRPTMAATAAAT